MTETVGEEGGNGTATEDFSLRAVVEDAKLEQSRDGNGGGVQVERVEDESGLDARDALFLHASDNVVWEMVRIG